MENKIDLVKKRENYVPKPEDKVVLPEQVEVGKSLDTTFHKEMMLRNNINEFPISDFTKILYRLPINEKQMKEIYDNLLSK
jgi:hypothetical protein